jgi:hypothetical protein
MLSKHCFTKDVSKPYHFQNGMKSSSTALVSRVLRRYRRVTKMEQPVKQLLSG